MSSVSLCEGVNIKDLSMENMKGKLTAPSLFRRSSTARTLEASLTHSDSFIYLTLLNLGILMILI